MSSILAQFSDEIATAADRAGASIVQVYGHHRPVAGVVVADNLVAAPSHGLGDDTTSVRLPDGRSVEGTVLGHAFGAGLAAVRVDGLSLPPLAAADEPRVGHLGVAVGRTWSGGLMAALTSVAVVGGPLRTSRASQLDRVIRIARPPHGALTGGALVDGEGRALGLITASAIRGTTVVIPAAIAWRLVQRLVDRGGRGQGFLGISSAAVALPERQRAGRAQEYGLLVNAVVPDSPADAAGLLVGDVIVAFDGVTVEEPEALLTLLRGDRVGKTTALSILRAADLRDVPVAVGDRPRRERRDGRHRR